jgi:hypothetical protein
MLCLYKYKCTETILNNLNYCKSGFLQILKESIFGENSDGASNLLKK